jgi:hypothetical protein
MSVSFARDDTDRMLFSGELARQPEPRFGLSDLNQRSTLGSLQDGVTVRKLYPRCASQECLYQSVVLARLHCSWGFEIPTVAVFAADFDLILHESMY